MSEVEGGSHVAPVIRAGYLGDGELPNLETGPVVAGPVRDARRALGGAGHVGQHDYEMHVGGVDHGPEVVDGGGQRALARDVEALAGAHRSGDMAGVDIPIRISLEHNWSCVT